MLGIFDSGLGGLTVVRAIEKKAPQQSFLYLGDTARLPYGTKSPQTIERYALQAMGFLKEQKATTPVIACHTVSTMLLTRPRVKASIAKMFDGMVFDVATPAIAAAKRATKNKRIGILGTTATIHSGAYQRALSGFRTVPVAASVLVALAEEGWTAPSYAAPIVQKILQPFRTERVDTVILGCTHFPLLRRVIRDILGSGVSIIDPGEELARELRAAKLSKKSTTKHFFATDIPRDFSQRASLFLGRSIKASLVEL